MIEIIVFDVGGVYLEGSLNSFLRKSFGLMGGEFVREKKEVVFDSDYNKGLISSEECFSNVFKQFEIGPVEMEKIKDLWTSTWKLNEDMKKLVDDLGKNYRLAILSNSDELNSANYRNKGWYDPFEEVVLSHEEGVLKPNVEIYEILLKKLGASPENCVLIDDQEDCLLPARKMGMRTILYKSLENLKDELEKLGIKIN